MGLRLETSDLKGEKMEEKKRNTFSGSLGFVLAAAGSAVGLGNIWRFPYLAARGGGGLFLVVYLALALTFGFTMLVTEVGIGRKTKQSPLTAYGHVKKGWGWLGVIASIVPFMIMPYYCVIGGWVLKYFIVYVTGHGADAAEDGFFTGFITSQYEPIVMLFIPRLSAVSVFSFLSSKNRHSPASRSYLFKRVSYISLPGFTWWISYDTRRPSRSSIKGTPFVWILNRYSL